MTYNLPMPNDEYDGRTVIASVWTSPTDDLGLLILLNDQPAFYSVVEVDLTTLRNTSEVEFTNINQAVAHYAQAGGDI